MMALYLPYKAVGVPHSTYVTPTAQRKVQQSKLANGIRVATIGHKSPIVSIGVYVKGGSRYETREVTGVTHFLKQMAFRTNHHRFDYRMVRDIEALGANLTISAGREYMQLTSEVPYTAANELPRFLSEIVGGPHFLEYEVISFSSFLYFLSLLSFSSLFSMLNDSDRWRDRCLVMRRRWRSSRRMDRQW
jgi:mitochondrial-processing peptidase subunit alpha